MVGIKKFQEMWVCDLLFLLMLCVHSGNRRFRFLRKYSKVHCWLMKLFGYAQQNVRLWQAESICEQCGLISFKIIIRAAKVEPYPIFLANIAIIKSGSGWLRQLPGYFHGSAC